MKNIQNTFIGILVICSLFLISQTTNAQTRREEYRGNIISFNGPRVRTASFVLKINRWTSDEQANQNLSILQNDGQDKLLDVIRKENVGTISFNNGLSRTINVVRETQVDGKTRVFAVFERWMNFAEIRGGYRSVDYPFGIIELMIDPTSGKGEGIFIGAAQIRWNKDPKDNEEKVKIENFGTYPAKMVNVKMTFKDL